ncbi:MAG: dTDP-glucose 4,6-dehydratase, partial [Duodenibacillus sp.]
MILVTGSAGFIGSNFVIDWCARTHEAVVSLDALTYAGNPANLSDLAGNPLHELVVGDIGDAPLVSALLKRARPRAVVHFAAQSHVDRSIADPQAFLTTNVVGTATLLTSVRDWLAQEKDAALVNNFRFLHVSTDEVYGSLGIHDAPFAEDDPPAPNSPYSASKAAAEHVVHAWQRTYGLKAIVARCSNNYGPRQFPEKLIPLVIARALAGRPIPIYGRGQNVRDWIHVDDTCAALRCMLEKGEADRTYNVSAHQEVRNIDLVRRICALVDEMRP